MNQINIIASTDTFNRGYRLDPSQYSVVTEQLVRSSYKSGIQMPTLESLGCINEIYLPGRFNRCYTGNEKLGVPMLGTSTMLNMRLPNNDRVFLDKIRNGKELYIRPNDILISRSGTVGTSVLCGASYSKHIASDHCLRVRINDEYRGYIAAYLHTAYGYALLEKDAHGKVIKELVEENIRNLPIMMFDNIIDNVNELILQSTIKYDAARVLLENVELNLKKYLKEFIPAKDVPSNNIVSFSELHINRLDPHMHEPYTNYMFRAIEGAEHCILGDVADVWGTSRFKRHYLKADNEFAVGLYSSSDIVRANLSPSKYISRTLNSKDLKKGLIRKGTVLIPCSGAYGGVIGHGMLAGKLMDGKAVTQHVLRVVSKENINIYPDYLYAFLCSDNFGYPMIVSTRFGKDIPELDPEVLKRIPIPIISKESQKDIGDAFKQASLLQEEANILENRAINMIEEEYRKRSIE